MKNSVHSAGLQIHILWECSSSKFVLHWGELSAIRRRLRFAAHAQQVCCVRSIGRASGLMSGAQSSVGHAVWFLAVQITKHVLAIWFHVGDCTHLLCLQYDVAEPCCTIVGVLALTDSVSSPSSLTVLLKQLRAFRQSKLK